MLDVDRMFKHVVDPWWDCNRTRESPNFEELRTNISSFNELCRHAAWNEIGHHLIRDQRQILGLQCLVEALLCSPTNNSAAWSAFRSFWGSELPDGPLSSLPRRPDPRDIHQNEALAQQLAALFGRPGEHPPTTTPHPPGAWAEAKKNFNSYFANNLGCGVVICAVSVFKLLPMTATSSLSGKLIGGVLFLSGTLIGGVLLARALRLWRRYRRYSPKQSCTEKEGLR